MTTPLKNIPPIISCHRVEIVFPKIPVHHIHHHARFLSHLIPRPVLRNSDGTVKEGLMRTLKFSTRGNLGGYCANDCLFVLDPNLSDHGVSLEEQARLAFL